MLAQLQIQGGQRFIQQQHARFNRQRAGNGDTLTLPARQFARHPVAVSLQRDQAQQLVGALAAFSLANTARLQPEGDVFPDRHQRKQRQGLEDHRGRPLVGPKAPHIAPADQHASLGGFQESRDHAQDGGLATARRPQDRKELARLNLEGHVADCAR